MRMTSAEFAAWLARQPKMPTIAQKRPATPSQRSNRVNDGRAFEDALESIFECYAAAGVMRVRKVEPPTRIVGTGAQRKVIFLANPFLDFVGTWTQRKGAMLNIEAKSTSEPRLPINRAGGVSESQVRAIREWSLAGAYAVVFWEWEQGLKIITPAEISTAVNTGRASLKWGDCQNEVLPGTGFERWQIERTLARLFP